MTLLKRLPMFLMCLLLAAGHISFAQNGKSQIISTGQRLNAIQSTVPFVTITPDSRAGALGDAGVATSPDINSQHYNPAKYAFVKGSGGVALSYTPWLRKLIQDINLAYLSGFVRIDDKQAVSATLRYFSLGEIIMTDIYGVNQGQIIPNEFAVDAAYSRLLTDHFSGGIAFRFIRSDLTAGNYVNGEKSEPGMAVAGDLAFYYMNNELIMGKKDGGMAFGVNISNMGNKISYLRTQKKAFIPINMRLGGALTVNLDDYNSMTFTGEMSKLLVPTPPEYKTDDSTHQTIMDEHGNPVIAHGMDPDVPVPLGMLHSFYDAPGIILKNGNRSVLLEELHEIMYSTGIEYWYREQFAIRGGYFHEHATKGNRKYFTVGIGLKLNVFGLDFSYLVPVKQNNPLANTLRFTLSFLFK